jgi:hypothetical protein
MAYGVDIREYKQAHQELDPEERDILILLEKPD